MKVIKADNMGFCFGVRDALAAAESEPTPKETTIHGELVHNGDVLHRLRRQGFVMSAEGASRDLPGTRRVLITAHGVSDRERQRLLAAGKDLVDTTCPLVDHAHRTALRLSKECEHVVVIGKPGHVEVMGLTEDLPTFDVVPTADEVRNYGVKTLGVLCQTTFPLPQANLILASIEALNPRAEVRFVDTICEPTKQRVRAVHKLVEQVDIVVVVGGANSNNTKELVRMCEAKRVPAVHVQGPKDLDPRMFASSTVVGLTAGTSTRNDAIEAVLEALVSLEQPNQDPQVS